MGSPIGNVSVMKVEGSLDGNNRIKTEFSMLATSFYPGIYAKINRDRAKVSSTRKMLTSIFIRIQFFSICY